MSGIGAFLGLTMAAALVLVWQGAPTKKRRATARVSDLIAHATGNYVPAAPTPFASVLDRLFSGRRSLDDRLQAAGIHTSADAFRLRQLSAMSIALAAAIAVELLISTGRNLALAPAVLLALVCASAGLIAPEWLLDRSIRQRRSRIEAQLPHVAELVAFALSAGESPVSSIERVVRTTSGPLTDEMRTVVADVRTGHALADALQAMVRRTSARSVERFVDSLLVAVERGTPLADVMRAQAADARAAAHRELLTRAGRAEVLMLIPVIFLVLPTVVVIALYPGLSALTTSLH